MVKEDRVSMEVDKEVEQEAEEEELEELVEDVEEDQVDLVLLPHPQATPMPLQPQIVTAALAPVQLQHTDSLNSSETMVSLLTTDMVLQVVPAPVMVLLEVLLLWIRDTVPQDPQQGMDMEPHNTLEELAEGGTQEKLTRNQQTRRQYTKELYQFFDSQSKIFLILLITMMTEPTHFHYRFKLQITGRPL